MRENDAGVLRHCTRAALPLHLPRTYLGTLDGRVRMVAIKDFDAQACGGTQVADPRKQAGCASCARKSRAGRTSGFASPSIRRRGMQ